MKRSFVCCLIIALSTLGLIGCGNASSSSGPSFDQQFEEAKQVTNPQTRASRLTKLARNQYDAGKSTDASESIEEAILACREITDISGRASAYNALASVQAHVGQSTTAKNTLGLAREAIEEISDPSTKASQLGRVALTYGEIDNLTAAKAQLSKAETTVASLQEAKRATALARLAVIASLIDVQDEADRYLEAATAAANSVVDPREQSQAFTSLSSAHRRMDQDEMARGFFERAVDAADKIESLGRRAHALADLVEVQMKRNRTEAKTLLDRAEKIADQISESDLRRQASDRINKLRLSL